VCGSLLVGVVLQSGRGLLLLSLWVHVLFVRETSVLLGVFCSQFQLITPGLLRHALLLLARCACLYQHARHCGLL
jgi:hypothetical protein